MNSGRPQWPTTYCAPDRGALVKSDNHCGDMWDTLPRISCPTLLIHGSLSDVLSKEMAVRTRNAIPDCRLVEIEAGHLAHLENPNEFISLVREFLVSKRR